MTQKIKKIYISGHQGLLGSALLKCLSKKKFELYFLDKKKLNLLDQKKIFNFLKNIQPDLIFHCASVVGGIKKNMNYPFDMIHQNNLININLIEACRKYDIKKLICFNSTCAFPLSKKRIDENDLLNGPLEKSSEFYSVAKINLAKSIESLNKQYNKNHIVINLPNLYGPNDIFIGDGSHVVPALIHKFHIAKIKNMNEVYLFGNGKPKRELLLSNDVAKKIIEISFSNKKGIDSINLGPGNTITIKDLAKKIKKITKFKGEIIFEKDNKLNGAPIKKLNYRKLRKEFPNLVRTSSLDFGLKKTYQWYLNNIKKLR